MLSLLERARQGEVVDNEKLFFQAIAVQNELIDIIISEDPCLPLELLPPDWPSPRAHQLFHQLTDLIDQLKLVGHGYHFLLYSMVKGMETLELYWPREEQPAGQSWERSQA